MKPFPDCIGVIPARYGSTRFPGKPLAEIHGKPMFWHVYRRASRCRELGRVVLATDDDRIRAAAARLDVPVVMTRPDHPSGSDRVLDAARQLGVADDAVVVNIQGDEPTLEPQLLSELLAPFAAAATRVTTPARRAAATEADTPDAVKVVFSKTGRALYFSRSAIPFYRDGQTNGTYRHIGIYAFRMEALKRFVALGPSPLEKAEQLEQLRLLENDIPIQVVVTTRRSVDVNRPEDIAAARRILANEDPAATGRACTN
ncbi:MAG: 3-deoxy-manno-octulosonate cytidylyltransferase [Desulfobacterales bacterium]